MRLKSATVLFSCLAVCDAGCQGWQYLLANEHRAAVAVANPVPLSPPSPLPLNLTSSASAPAAGSKTDDAFYAMFGARYQTGYRWTYAASQSFPDGTVVDGDTYDFRVVRVDGTVPLFALTESVPGMPANAVAPVLVSGDSFVTPLSAGLSWYHTLVGVRVGTESYQLTPAMMTVTGTEDLAVPAGVFHGAVRVSGSVGTGIDTISRIQWFFPGIGVVKDIHLVFGPRGSETWQLQWFQGQPWEPRSGSV